MDLSIMYYLFWISGLLCLFFGGVVGLFDREAARDYVLIAIAFGVLAIGIRI